MKPFNELRVRRGLFTPAPWPRDPLAERQTRDDLPLPCRPGSVPVRSLFRSGRACTWVLEPARLQYTCAQTINTNARTRSRHDRSRQLALESTMTGARPFGPADD